MNLNNNLTKDFAYVLGVIYGDACCYSRKEGGTTILKVKDRDFALKFKESLEQWSKLKVKFKKKRDFYWTILYSKPKAEVLLNFDINKIPKSEKEIKLNFLSGLFDSEGGNNWT